MSRARTVAIVLGTVGLAGAAFAAVRHRGGAMGRSVPGGILIGDVAAYDALSHRFVLGSLFGPIAADIAAIAPGDRRVLEVGCGPGHLTIRLARDHGIEATGLDLDPAMIERARANAERDVVRAEGRPSFVVGDVASLPFPDRSFDLVVSTLSMHHWADPSAGLTEIHRVLRPGGRALIWDLRPGAIPLHRHMSDPLERMHGTPLRVVSATPWQWPWKLRLTQRIELARLDDGSIGAVA